MTCSRAKPRASQEAAAGVVGPHATDAGRRRQGAGTLGRLRPLVGGRRDVGPARVADQGVDGVVERGADALRGGGRAGHRSRAPRCACCPAGAGSPGRTRARGPGRGRRARRRRPRPGAACGCTAGRASTPGSPRAVRSKSRLPHASSRTSFIAAVKPCRSHAPSGVSVTGTSRIDHVVMCVHHPPVPGRGETFSRRSRPTRLVAQGSAGVVVPARERAGVPYVR